MAVKLPAHAGMLTRRQVSARLQQPGSWQVEEITHDEFDWMVHLKYPVLSSRVKTLGLASYWLSLAMAAFLTSLS